MPERLRAHPKPDAKGLRVKGEPEYILWDSSVEPIRPQRTERFPPLSKNTFTGIPTVYREWRPGRKVSVHFQTLEKSNMAVKSRTLFGTMHLVVCVSVLSVSCMLLQLSAEYSVMTEFSRTSCGWWFTFSEKSILSTSLVHTDIDCWSTARQYEILFSTSYTHLPKPAKLPRDSHFSLPSLVFLPGSQFSGISSNF